jgi:hypothetical protein
MPTDAAARLTGSPRSTASRRRLTRSAMYLVAGGLRDDLERLNHRHACRHRDRQRARDARQRAFVHELADHRNAQLDTCPSE